MAKLRIGLIGLGMAVTPHARSLVDLKDRVEVACAFSPSEARRTAFGGKFAFPLCDRLDTVLGDRSVGAVMLLTPPNTHLDLVRQCAAAGKHILLEKPLEVSTARAVELVEACRRAGVTLGVGVRSFAGLGIGMGHGVLLLRQGRERPVKHAGCRG